MIATLALIVAAAGLAGDLSGQPAGPAVQPGDPIRWVTPPQLLAAPRLPPAVPLPQPLGFDGRPAPRHRPPPIIRRRGVRVPRPMALPVGRINRAGSAPGQVPKLFRPPLRRPIDRSGKME